MKLKRVADILKQNWGIVREYIFDCKDYIRFNYHRPKLRTKNAIEAKILRQAHVIEKGMSLTNPRAGFGVAKALTLLQYINDFCRFGFSIEDSAAVKNSLNVVGAYIRFHRERGFEPTEVVQAYQKLSDRIEDGFGIRSISYEKLQESIHGEFKDFFESRHSVRQFRDEKIKIEDIQKAVELAMHAPSACNRQSCKVYFYEDSRTNEALAEMIAGNTGFEREAANYLVLTSDVSAFYNEFERNQIYVDGGIFALALAEALHYYGIANCILQNGEFHAKNKKLHQLCGNIPENEKIILFIAIGYYKDEVVYASSHRKKLEDVLKIK